VLTSAKRCHPPLRSAVPLAVWPLALSTGLPPVTATETSAVSLSLLANAASVPPSLPSSEAQKESVQSPAGTVTSRDQTGLAGITARSNGPATCAVAACEVASTAIAQAVIHAVRARSFAPLLILVPFSVAARFRAFADTKHVPAQKAKCFYIIGHA